MTIILKKLTPSIALLSALFLSASAHAQVVVGYVGVDIAPSQDGVNYVITHLSCPLEPKFSISGYASGKITGNTSSTITANGAGWTANGLAAPSAPYYLKIASGAAQGNLFRITANTADTLTLDTRGIDLATLGIANGTDTFQIVAGYTLLSLFGTPAEGVVGGSAADLAANTVDKVLVNDTLGIARIYYYNTSAGQWRRLGSTSNQSNLPIGPHQGLSYYRISTQPVSFTFTGRVPDTDSRVILPESGTTLLATYFPVSSTLGALNIQATANWRKLGDPGVTLNTTDRVLAKDSIGVFRSYYHDGTSWKRLGSATNQNSVPIEPGAAIYATRFGGGAPDTWTRTIPYSLN